MNDRDLDSALSILKQANKEIERLAKFNAELIIKNNKLTQDKERLDLLDKCNAEFNQRMGSNYGWRVDWNHNRIALVDTGIPKTNVRTAIDKFKARLSMDNRNKENKSELDLVLDKYTEWPAKVSGSIIAYNGSNFMHCIESRLCLFGGYKRVCNEAEYNEAKQLRKEQNQC